MKISQIEKSYINLRIFTSCPPFEKNNLHTI
jgi:hypothetical protein